MESGKSVFEAYKKLSDEEKEEFFRLLRIYEEEPDENGEDTQNIYPSDDPFGLSHMTLSLLGFKG